MDKIKVGVIGLKGFPAFGGSARMGENLIELLKDKYHFTVYNTASHTNRKSGNYYGYTQIVFKQFFIKKLNTLIYYIKSTFHSLFKSEYTFIHFYHTDAAFVIPLLKLKYKVIGGIRARPHKVSKWNFIVKLYFYLMEYIFLKLPADIIICNSIPLINSIKNKTRKEIHYIPNGVLFNYGLKKLPKVEYKNYLLFASGRIIKSKGCHILLKALHRINYKGLLLIVGNLEHTPKYSRILKQLANGLNVKFIGLIKEKEVLMSYIKNAKLAVYPSFVEAMSNMLLEYASMYIPIICSNIPENIIVFNETEALHFQSRDFNDLADKIVWANNNFEKMKLMAKAAYSKLKKEYNLENLAEEYNVLFKKLIS